MYKNENDNGESFFFKNQVSLCPVHLAYSFYFLSWMGKFTQGTHDDL